MKLVDVVLITLAGLSLFLMSEELFRVIFSQSNNWIPDVFSDAVSWTPGAVFYTTLSSVVAGLFLVRFAPQPVVIALLTGFTVELADIYPMVQANGAQTTFTAIISSWAMAEKYLQAIIILPLVSYILYVIKRPNREHEVIEEDDIRY